MQEVLKRLVEPYAAALAKGGVTPVGIMWPNAPDLAKRFEVLFQGVDWAAYSSANRLRLLDFGCGPGFMLDYLAANGLLNRVQYTGVDITEVTLAHAQRRWPDQDLQRRNLLEMPFPEASFDYAVICGVFTARFSNSYEEMETFVCDALRAIWRNVRLGLSFNVMSKHVDWERDDLFHWPLDSLAFFCKANLSRHISLRLDYGPWEASAIVRREPIATHSIVPAAWLEGVR
jgi:SAM-dependent methyltransferase